jgi:hypothetical protein
MSGREKVEGRRRKTEKEKERRRRREGGKQRSAQP